MQNLAAGRVIGGRYEIVRCIAEGGMGAVYEARHTLSRKTVALKVLHAHIARDETSRARFLREISAPAHIGHDGIVEVYDAGFDTTDGSLFVAMELLRGETLRERLARGGLTRDDVLDLFEALLEPLAAAHAAGIVHRDLKPENVFVQRLRDGREIVKLLDFGIARDLDPQAAVVTQAGTSMGTPHYMAPEQAMSLEKICFATDSWAIGAMLYEALTGSTPFDGPTASAIVVQAVSAPHVPLATRAPTTPPALATLVDRCLEKEPGARPPTAGALLDAIRALRPSPHRTNPYSTSLANTAPFPVATASPAPGSQAAVAPTQALHAPHHTPQAPSVSTPSPVHTPAGFAAPTGNLAAMPALAHGTPVATPYGAPIPSPAPAATPYGAQGPSGVPSAAPTPPPPRRTGLRLGIGFLILVGIVSAFTAATVLALAVAAVTLDEDGDLQTSARLEIRSDTDGQLFVDGLVHGDVHAGGAQLSLSPGAHIVEIRQNGRPLASARVDVTHTSASVQLQRGVFVTGPETTPQFVRGRLTTADRQLVSGEYVQSFPIERAIGQHLTLELSATFDAYLILRLPSGRQLDNDDASPATTAARIELTTDEAGTYEVLVTTKHPGEVGDFTLMVR